MVIAGIVVHMLLLLLPDPDNIHLHLLMVHHNLTAGVHPARAASSVPAEKTGVAAADVFEAIAHSALLRAIVLIIRSAVLVLVGHLIRWLERVRMAVRYVLVAGILVRDARLPVLLGLRLVELVNHFSEEGFWHLPPVSMLHFVCIVIHFGYHTLLFLIVCPRSRLALGGSGLIGIIVYHLPFLDSALGQTFDGDIQFRIKKK